MKKIKYKSGDIVFSPNNGEVRIDEYRKSTDVDITFLDTGGKRYGVDFGNLLRGNVKDLNRPVVKDKGYFGYGPYTHADHRDIYQKWMVYLDRDGIEEDFLSFQKFCEFITTHPKYEDYKNGKCDIKCQSDYVSRNTILFTDNPNISNRPNYDIKVGDILFGKYQIIGRSSSHYRHYKFRFIDTGNEYEATIRQLERGFVDSKERVKTAYPHLKTLWG